MIRPVKGQELNFESPMKNFQENINISRTRIFRIGIPIMRVAS